jgi:hypothetical protein
MESVSWGVLRFLCIALKRIKCVEMTTWNGYRGVDEVVRKEHGLTYVCGGAAGPSNKQAAFASPTFG